MLENKIKDFQTKIPMSVADNVQSMVKLTTSTRVFWQYQSLVNTGEFIMEVRNLSP